VKFVGAECFHGFDSSDLGGDTNRKAGPSKVAGGRGVVKVVVVVGRKAHERGTDTDSTGYCCDRMMME